MSDRSNLFPGGISISNAPLRVADSGEISLREELDSILNGTGGEVPKGRIFILRRLRRNSDGSPVQCVCVSETVYKQASHDYPCPHCLGAGFLWDEETFIAYKVIVTASSGYGVAKSNLPKNEYGVLETEEVRFYAPHTLEPKIRDRIVEIEYDTDGNLVSPLSRTSIWEIAAVRPMILDYGRVEYFIIHVSKNYQGTEGTVG